MTAKKEKPHVETWREVAYLTDTGKKIFFCACKSMQGDPFRGCGGVAIKDTHTSRVRIIQKPKEA